LHLLPDVCGFGSPDFIQALQLRFNGLQRLNMSHTRRAH
jgi:hypothetical protein